ncbi:MAG: DUF4190 domain-containing protein [Victivallales bacterium]|nr:DUF4190 domain-containing protein [Victivallales bacterium]
MATIICPLCNHGIQLDARFSGQVHTCPVCSGKFTVPEIPQTASTCSDNGWAAESHVGPSSKGLAITGFIFSFFCSIVGLVCCIIALYQMNRNNNPEGRGWAIAGLAVQALGFFFSVAFSVLAELLRTNL